MNTLPTEIVQSILIHLPWACHEAASRVCQRWRSIMLSRPLQDLRYQSALDRLPVYSAGGDDQYVPPPVDDWTLSQRGRGSAEPGEYTDPSQIGLHRLLVGYANLWVSVQGYDHWKEVRWVNENVKDNDDGEVRLRRRAFIASEFSEDDPDRLTSKKGTVQKLTWSSHPWGLYEMGHVAYTRPPRLEIEESDSEEEDNGVTSWWWDKKELYGQDGGFYHNYLEDDMQSGWDMTGKPRTMMVWDDPIVSPALTEQEALNTMDHIYFRITDAGEYAICRKVTIYAGVRELMRSRKYPSFAELAQCLVDCMVAEHERFLEVEIQKVERLGKCQETDKANNNDDDVELETEESAKNAARDGFLPGHGSFFSNIPRELGEQTKDLFFSLWGLEPHPAW